MEGRGIIPVLLTIFVHFDYTAPIPRIIDDDEWSCVECVKLRKNLFVASDGKPFELGL